MLYIPRQPTCMKLGIEGFHQPIQSCTCASRVHTCHLPRDIQQICCSARQDSIRPYRAHAVMSGHCNIIYTACMYTEPLTAHRVARDLSPVMRAERRPGVCSGSLSGLVPATVSFPLSAKLGHRDFNLHRHTYSTTHVYMVDLQGQPEVYDTCNKNTHGFGSMHPRYSQHECECLHIAPRVCPLVLQYCTRPCQVFLEFTFLPKTIHG